MSTVGHFTSMIGVFCFYITLLESHFERKLTVYTFNLLPRMYNDCSYLYLKRINLVLNKKRQTILPVKKTKKFLNRRLR